MKPRSQPLLPRHVGDEAGDATSYMVLGIFIRRAGTGGVIRSVNLAGHFFLPLRGEEARPLLDAWGVDPVGWLERRIRVRLRRAPRPDDIGDPDTLNAAFQIEPLLDKVRT